MSFVTAIENHLKKVSHAITIQGCASRECSIDRQSLLPFACLKPVDLLPRMSLIKDADNYRPDDLIPARLGPRCTGCALQ
jgi:hypothetical protein